MNNFNIKLLLITFLVITALGFTLPKSLPDYDFGKVIEVIDGDTIKVATQYRGIQTVRLYKLDAFETKKYKRISKQLAVGRNENDVILLGQKAKSVVSDLVLNAPVLLVFEDNKYEYYGRLLAQVMFINENIWVDLSEFMCSNYKDLYWHCE